MISLRHWSWGLFCAVILLFSSSVSATDYGDHWRNRPLKVVTQNLFIGGDLDTILEGGSPEDFFQEILRSNPPERLKALAQKIRRERPHVIGLQEVALIRVQAPGDFDLGILLPNAEDIYLDFLEIFLKELNSRGPLYKVAAVQRNIDAELPVDLSDADIPAIDPGSYDIRMTDRDVILARWDVPVANLTAGIYNNLRVLQFQGTLVQVRRGFTVVKAWIGGNSIAIANTHLDNKGNQSTVQATQAADLINELNSIDLPTVILGDMNSGPDDLPFSPYSQFLAADFKDAWVERSNDYFSPDNPDGNTCCQDKDLGNEESELDRRIDLVLFRSSASDGSSDSWRVRTHLIGDQPLEDPISPLLPIPPPYIYWASDHAGVAAELRMH